MILRGPIPRRTFLRGVGTAMALPLLEGMLPGGSVSSARAAAVGAAAPQRIAFFYVPNGVQMPDWTPSTVGSGFEFPSILEPLEPFRRELLVLSGLAHDKANANGDGGGDHARAVATFLTGCQAYKTAGKDIRAGVSVDQMAAQRVGHLTRFPSLELGCERGREAGACDTGYSCVYSNNISWRSPSTPQPKQIDPRMVFQRLFSSGDAGEERAVRDKKARYRLSILDLVQEDTRSLKTRLGQSDRRKLDEYMDAVRELEQRAERSSPHGSSDLAAVGDASAGSSPDQRPVGMAEPAGIPDDYGEHIRLLEDLLVLAFQCDLTRISTFMYGNAGSNRSYRLIDVPEGHHDLSHHGGNKEKQQKISRINRFHAEQFAHLLGKLRSVQEGDCTLLDRCLIVYGSAIGDGNRHNHNDLPILVAGGGGGRLAGGRHLSYPQGTPLMNLYLSLLDLFGVQVDEVGDSTGRIDSLTA